jgi:hypothetical protein
VQQIISEAEQSMLAQNKRNEGLEQSHSDIERQIQTFQSEMKINLTKTTNNSDKISNLSS